MWGEPERALHLEPSDPLSIVLFQVAGPAHIPWQDARWQELLCGYNIWVHVDDHQPVLAQSSRSLTSHAARSSNLACLCLHVARMLRELLPQEQPEEDTDDDAVAAFSHRIALVGKARATAGALQLLRILVHAVLDMSCKTCPDNEAWLTEVFGYASRDTNAPPQDAGADLLHALLHFLTCSRSALRSDAIPELYDAVNLALQLVLVLLSSQLYQPMISSYQRKEASHTEMMGFYFWDRLLPLMARQQDWSAPTLVATCLDWQMHRPTAPARSIAHHNYELAQSVAQAKGERLAPDGMYESYLVVMARAPSKGTVVESTVATQETKSSSAARTHHAKHGFLDATKGVLVLSSTIILLPFRLMSLALGLWGHREKGYDQVHKQQLQSYKHSNLTKDVLWLTESPIADLASSLLLLLTNNDRANPNPFRTELEALVDNRWEVDGSALPDLPDPLAALPAELSASEDLSPLLDGDALVRNDKPSEDLTMTANFEGLFESFGWTCHTEVGALLLYTILMASPGFRDFIAVRSDLDTLVLPLLRTLYFSSSLRHYSAQDYSSRAHPGSSETTSLLAIRNCPFRSSSQLYVIIILLLLFSQDASFGTDAFRRIMVPIVPWYKERNLKEISLGSVLLLVLLRSLTFNLNRLHDTFLLSNCSAVLMNLAPSIVDLHDYAAMRLVSVTVSSTKRYLALRQDKQVGGDEDDMSSPVAMYGEVTRTLLGVLNHCLSPKNIERNIHVVYALVYHQADFKKAWVKGHPFKKREIGRIERVIAAASKIIEVEGASRAAPKALKALADNKDEIREAAFDTSKRQSEQEDFTFTYEEEADPEIFFVPLVWEIIVCCVTSSLVEWRKDQIKVFPLLEDAPPEDTGDEEENAAPVHVFSQDVSDVV